MYNIIYYINNIGMKFIHISIEPTNIDSALYSLDIFNSIHR